VIEPFGWTSSSTKYQTAVDYGRPLISIVVSVAVRGERRRSRWLSGTALRTSDMAGSLGG